MTSRPILVTVSYVRSRSPDFGAGRIAGGKVHLVDGTRVPLLDFFTKFVEHLRPRSIDEILGRGPRSSLTIFEIRGPELTCTARSFDSFDS